MTSPAQKARVTQASHVQIEDLRVTVLEVEGTVQLVWAREWNDSWTTLFNEFAGPDTARAFRRLAARIDAANARLTAGAGESR